MDKIKRQTEEETVEHSWSPKTQATRKAIKEFINNNDAVCWDCAEAKGWVPVDRVVGHWFGECSFCNKEKSVNAIRDWKKHTGERK